MKIGLMDIDGHNFPNLALMKLSAWFKNKGAAVEFVNHFKEYDVVFKSKVFTFTSDDTHYVKSEIIKYGGTGYNAFWNLQDHIEHTCPDYSLYNYPHALGFLTRGCIRKCTFCIVPHKEGWIKDHADIDEFLDGRKTAVLLDNNALASKHGLKQIEKIISLGIKVDFNQGLDARLIDDNIAKLLSKVKWLRPIRMACDSQSMIKPVESAVKLLRKHGATPCQYFVYMIINGDINEALDRFYFLRNLKVDPFAQPLITDIDKPTKEQKKLARYINSRQLRNISWEEYKYR